jgi:hypothetical protein
MSSISWILAMTFLNDLNQDTRKDKDFFYFTIPGLTPGQDLPVNLRWQKADGSRGLWSSAKVLTPPLELGSSLPIPYFVSSNVTANPGMILVAWNGNDILGNPIKNIDHVGVFITDSKNTFGDGTKEVASIKKAGIVAIPAPSGTYSIRLASVSARGAIGTKTEPVSVTIQGVIKIESPTLPIGLSVAPAPFGVTASWGGKYKDDAGFSGFKSINIYVSKTDLGTSTTSTANPTLSNRLVGTMTVDTDENKITIGMEVLKQVLKSGSPLVAPTSAELYAMNLYFYHVAVNANGLPYQVDGVTTYTRINSTGIAPAAANKIDLAAGLISIENLVAGNGQFTSWLRTGTAGGARIELSSSNVDSAEAGGYEVASGFTVYKSNGDVAFQADLSGNVSFGGYTPANIKTIKDKADAAATSTDLAATNESLRVQAIAQAALFAKTAQFNNDGSQVVLPIQIPTNEGSIYSNKSAFDSTNKGWFLGNLVDTTTDPDTFTPVFSIGDMNNPTVANRKGMEWNGSALKIIGTLEASTITGSSFTVEQVATNNYWNASAFKLGNANSYIYSNGTTITIMGKATTSATGVTSEDATSAYAGGSRIEVKSSGVEIYGIPTQGDIQMTYGYGTNTSAPYMNQSPLGPAPRQRMLVEHPVSGQTLLGMAVYYGSRTTAPTASVGVIGDIWVSWLA